MASTHESEPTPPTPGDPQQRPAPSSSRGQAATQLTEGIIEHELPARAKRGEIGIGHHGDELREADARLPTEPLARERRIAEETLDLGRTKISRVNRDYFSARSRVDTDFLFTFPSKNEINPEPAEGECAELAHAVRLTGGKHVITGLVLLYHAPHPLRDAQFRFINEEIRKALAAGRPVISVDTKKKELLGNYENVGRQWRKAKTPHRVNVHDFPHPDVPRAHPYGIYDLGRNTGFVTVGTDHDTGAFAVASIRGWWRAEGRRLYPDARSLLITADGGGSNGYRLRQWKMRLQALADEAQLVIRVCHFPPGTSKWNKVEHRLFSFISSNWRGEPLRDYETIVRLIARTTTAKGLRVTCRLDRRRYPIGHKGSDAEIATVNLVPHAFHGEWNYRIRPHPAL